MTYLDLIEFPLKFNTTLGKSVTIPKLVGQSALVNMLVDTVDPNWMIYLPPTMSPVDVSENIAESIEHPVDAFRYYAERGVQSCVCEYKHMGSRAIAIVCRNSAAVDKYFPGVYQSSAGKKLEGMVYTRYGRRFFEDEEIERGFIERIQGTLEQTEFWDRMNAEWVCFDGEIMPWSAKGSLKINDYVPVTVSARYSLNLLRDRIQEIESRYFKPAEEFREFFEQQVDSIEKFTQQYERYCWPADKLQDYKYAIFHIIATNKQVYASEKFSHLWHMKEILNISSKDHEHESPLINSTFYRTVDLSNESSKKKIYKWWEYLTEKKGAEGIVVKPTQYVTRGSDKNLVQPALKVRGKNHLRLAYGPSYTDQNQIELLRERSTPERRRKKRELAIKEFALGIEAARRKVNGAPTRDVQLCVLGILALETSRGIK